MLPGENSKAQYVDQQLPALHQDAFGLLVLVDYMFVPSQLTVQGYSQELGGQFRRNNNFKKKQSFYLHFIIQFYLIKIKINKQNIH